MMMLIYVWSVMSFWAEGKAEVIVGLFDEVVFDNYCSKGPYGWLGLSVLPECWALLLAGVRLQGESGKELHHTTDLAGDHCRV